MPRVSAAIRLLLATALGAAAAGAPAQQDARPNGVFLVAKPRLIDPNFRQAVVLVTRTPESGTVGVIINRPTKLRLRQFLSEEFATRNYRDPVFSGGPVMRQALVAVFRAEAPPSAPAFHVLKGLYLTMHPDNIQPLLADPARRYRLYAGFSGWAPRQLEGELERDGWYVLAADAETVFRRDMEGVWQELARRAETRPVREMKSPAVGGAVCPESPGGAARAALVSTWHEATSGARRDAASFVAALALPRYPDGRPESRFFAAGQPGRGCELREKVNTSRAAFQDISHTR